MPQDITAELKLAKVRQSGWSELDFFEILKRIHSQFEFNLDWDDGAGECWASFIGSETEVMVCWKLPLIFVQAHVHDVLVELLSGRGIVVVGVDSFHEENLSVAPGVIEDVFGSETGALGNTISVNELWFHTV